jgi:hypothetical protein
MPTPRTASQGYAISVGGSLEPIEPVYTNANRQSVLGTQYNIPTEPVWSPSRTPIVHRGQDTRGMRYLYSDARTRQPISPLGTGPDLGNAVWNSAFQPILGVLRDWGFYDLLYRAGYPGFNLGLSFKVPQNPSIGTNSPGANIKMRTPNVVVTMSQLKRGNWAASVKG